MSESISTMIAQPFTLGSSFTMTVTDQGRTGATLTYGTGATVTYWRMWLASSNTPGTPSTDSAAPKDFIKHIQAVLGAHYSVTLNGAGLVAITYTGTGTSTVIDATSFFGSDPGLLSYLLGFPTKYLTNALATNGTSTATYQPLYSMFAMGRAKATNWQPIPQKLSAQVMPDGSVFGWQDTSRRRVQSFDLIGHPYDYATATTLGSIVTPVWPTDTSRYFTPPPTRMSILVTSPWSLSDFFGTALGQLLGMRLGTYQSFTPGSTIDRGYILPETLSAMQATQPTAPNWSARCDWTGIKISGVAPESTA